MSHLSWLSLIKNIQVYRMEAHVTEHVIRSAKGMGRAGRNASRKMDVLQEQLSKNVIQFNHFVRGLTKCQLSCLNLTIFLVYFNYLIYFPQDKSLYPLRIQEMGMIKSFLFLKVLCVLTKFRSIKMQKFTLKSSQCDVYRLSAVIYRKVIRNRKFASAIVAKWRKWL